MRCLRTRIFVLLGLSLSLASVVADAQTARPLPPDEVISLTAARLPQGDLQLVWQIAPRVYLYKDQFKLTADNGADVAFDLPNGEVKDDPYFGTTEIFHTQVALRARREAVAQSGGLRVTYQGCAEDGICYPPIEKRVDLQTLRITEAEHADLLNAAPPPILGADAAGSGLMSRGFVPILAGFFGLGLLLAFTLCIFAMRRPRRKSRDHA